MERYYDESDNEPYFGSDDEGDEEISETYFEKDDVLNVMQLDIAQKELKQEVLDKAIAIAKATWFWRFKSLDKKLIAIQRAYFWLISVLETTLEVKE